MAIDFPLSTYFLIEYICFYGQTLVATVYGKGDTVICQAYGRIKVGVPSLVTLNVQSEQLDVGREMPIFPSLPQARIKNLKFPFILCSFYQIID